MTDKQLLQLIQQNRTSKAFARLYRYFPPVDKRIRSLGGSKADALDIYQDALVILCRKVQEGNFELSSSINTYLYSVCRFLWNDELKKRNRQNEIRWQEEMDVMDEQQWNELAKDDQRSKLAAKVLADLGKRCLQLLQLFYAENKSMKEIARKMEFSSQNIAKNQKYKCLERAKAKLKEVQEKINHL